MRAMIAVTLAGSCLLASRARATQATTAIDELVAAERAAIEKSAREGLAASLSTNLAKDGAVLWPGAPVLRGDAARSLLAAQRMLDTLKVVWQPLGIEMAQDGNFGVTWGVSLSIPPSREPRIAKYIAAWQREGGAWKIAAFVPPGLFPPAATVLPPGIAGVRWPTLPASGSMGPFIAADLAFSKLAGDSGAALAFERFAAPEAVTFGAGPLNRGPVAIGNALKGGPPSHWAWHPVLAGASSGGDLGFTVGEAEITPQTGATNYSKYLTIWRRLPNGSVRYLTDGGNGRPAAP